MEKIADIANQQTVCGHLAPFLTINPEVDAEEIENACLINKPWGDETVAIRVSSEATELMHALNTMRLPPRFTAVWHMDTKDIEFIFSPLKEDSELRSRSFSFVFSGVEYTCEYKDASNAPHLIINASRVVGRASDTNHRNTSSLKSFLRFQRAQADKEKVQPYILTSFWIRNVQIGEEDVVNLSKHLNFFMHYFDRSTPKIEIHEDPISEAQIEKPIRQPYGEFPAVITGRDLDPFLLGLWESSVRATDPIRRFLYSYQILEYAAFYYLREEIFQTVRRVIAAPDVLSHLSDASRQILDAVVEDRTSDESKMSSIIQQYVDPDLLWKEISPKASFFSNSVTFDGGFALPQLIKSDWKLEDFKTSWIPKLPDMMRKIRNALVHAREQRQSRSISPTSRNQHLLRPWTALMSALAQQVILFKEN